MFNVVNVVVPGVTPAVPGITPAVPGITLPVVDFLLKVPTLAGLFYTFCTNCTFRTNGTFRTFHTFRNFPENINLAGINDFPGIIGGER